MQWAMRTHTDFQRIADDLWDGLDTLQSQEQFDAILAAYNEICDSMDLIERSPECVRTGHLSEVAEQVDEDGFALRCPRCGTLLSVVF